MKSRGIARSRWAAIGAAVAVCLGAGGIGITQAATPEDEKAIYRPIEPCRLLDTRPEYKVGAATTLQAGDITLDGWGSVGNCELLGEPTGLSLNVTAVFPTLPTYLTLYPTGTTRTDASHLNPMPGDFATPNAVNVDLNNVDGQFNVFNLQGAVDLVIDVVGLYDDHNHDDRYYTRDEVNALITNGGTPGEFYTEDEVDTLLDAKADESVLPFAVTSDPDPDGAVDLGTAPGTPGNLPESVVASVTVDAPAGGNVLLNYSTYVVPSSNSPDSERAGCSLGTGTTLNLETQGSSVGWGERFTLSGTNVIAVAAGPITFNVVCDTLNGTGTGSMTAGHPTLTAIYTPAP